MENIPSQDETSLSVLDHEAVRSSLEALNKKKKLVPLRIKSATKLNNMLQFMDLLPL